MDVGKVRMPMAQPTMHVLVSVGLVPDPVEAVLVTMMFIVSMGMRMCQWLMYVLMLMMLGYVQPHPPGHA